MSRPSLPICACSTQASTGMFSWNTTNGATAMRRSGGGPIGLAENTARLQAQRNPRFVTAQHDADLSPIPEIEARPVDGDASNGHHCAIISNQDFVLYSGPTKIDSYELPVYEDASGRVKQVAITPIAVAADLTIVGGVLF